LNTGNVLIGGYGSIPRDDHVDVGHGLFLPRVGVAYRLTNSTVIRAGFGQSADPNNWRYFRSAYPSTIIIANNVTNVGSITPFIPVASLTGLNGTGLGGGSVPTLDTGIKLTPLPDLSSGVVSFPTNTNTTTIRSPFHRGYINSFNLMVQHEWKGLVVETGYVGARAVRPLVNMNVNASPPSTGFDGGLLNVALGRTVAAKTAFTGNINAEVPFKNNYYDSLQTKVTRRFKQGSQASFVWTWSKATDYSSNEELNFLLFPYPTNWSMNKAVANFDRTHNIKIYGLLVPPFGKGQRWLQSGVGNWILGGWQVNPVVSRLTGLPFTVTGSGGLLNSNGSTQTADLVGPFHLSGGRPPRTTTNPIACAQNDPTCHYFDPTLFAQPWICTNPGTNPGQCGPFSPAHFGNTGRNAFRGPGYFEMDLSISRSFKLTERFALQIRGEAFSLTNTPHFANPNVSCPGVGTGQGPFPGSGGLCNNIANSTFGVITQTLQPGGFFGPDSGSRTIWVGARLVF